MENLKLNVKWGESLLELQQSGEDHDKGFCDLKLVCSDGYVWVHKALFPRFNSRSWSPPEGSSDKENAPPSPQFSYLDPNSRDLMFLTLTVGQMSKLVFLIYTGEALMSRSDKLALGPIFTAFQLGHLKRVPFLQTSAPVTRARRSRSSSATATSAVKGLGTPTASSSSSSAYTSREDLVKRKVLAVKFTNGGGGDSTPDGESVFIFGDGSAMAVPLSKQSNASSGKGPDKTVYYDENGRLSSDVLEGVDKGYFCEPCSLIFCDGSDYLAHSKQCTLKSSSNPPTPLTSRTVIKMEEDDGSMEVKPHISVENDDNKMMEDDNHQVPRPISTLNVCLICVVSCKDASELIIHSNQKHLISPDKDYDLGTWKCKRCKLQGSSNELAVFLQHVFRCRREKRKRQSSTKEKDPLPKQNQNLSTSNDTDNPPESPSNKRIRVSISPPNVIQDNPDSSDKNKNESNCMITNQQDEDVVPKSPLKSGDQGPEEDKIKVSSQSPSPLISSAISILPQMDNLTDKPSDNTNTKSNSNVTKTVLEAPVTTSSLSAPSSILTALSSAPTPKPVITDQYPPALSAYGGYQIPKLSRKLSLSTDPPSSSFSPNLIKDTSEILVCSPKSLVTTPVNHADTHKNVTDKPTADTAWIDPLKITPSNQKRGKDATNKPKATEQAPVKSATSLKPALARPIIGNPAVTFKGVTLNAPGGMRKMGEAKEGTGSAIGKGKEVVQVQKAKPIAKPDSTEQWLQKKKKKKKTQAVTPTVMPTTSDWICRRCDGRFQKQRDYMHHDCKRPTS